MRIAVIGQTTTQPIPPPNFSTSPEGIAFLLAGIGVGGKFLVDAVQKVFDLWNKKEDSESALTRDLVNNLLESQRSLIQLFQGGMERIVAEQQKQTQLMQQDFQQGKTAQAIQYAETRQALTSMAADLASIREDVAASRRETMAFHRRFDSAGVGYVGTSEQG